MHFHSDMAQDAKGTLRNAGKSAWEVFDIRIESERPTAFMNVRGLS